MKIRTGFVSNSSSSSFLVVYKSLKDFEKLDRFDGYKKFTEDLSETNSVEGLAVLRGMLHTHVYENFDRRMNFGYFEYSEDIWKLIDLAEIDVESLDELTDTYEPIIEEFNNKIFKKFPDKYGMLVCTKDRYRACMSAEENKFINVCRSESSYKFFDNKFQVALNKKIDKLADTLLRKLHSKGYTVRAVRYEDETEEESMMEHGFLPFIANNPEREYEIFQVNEH